MARERGFTAGDDALDEIGRDVEGGRAFGGVEHAEAAAGACAYVEEASAGAKDFDDGVDGLRDVGEFGGDGIGYAAVFGVDDLEHFEGGFFVDAGGGGVGLFGEEFVEVVRHQGLLYGQENDAKLTHCEMRRS